MEQSSAKIIQFSFKNFRNNIITILNTFLGKFKAFNILVQQLWMLADNLEEKFEILDICTEKISDMETKISDLEKELSLLKERISSTISNDIGTAKDVMNILYNNYMSE